jgi:SET domain-containing protein
MHKNSIYTQESEKGQAVFAKKKFIEGEFIVQFTGKVYSREEYLKLHDPDNNHYIQTGDGIFMGPSGNEDDLINHSCNPNCGLKISEDGVFLYAIRDIERGEEITFDYSTTMDEDHWEMECCCGDSKCRRKIKDFKYLPEDIKRLYVSLGIVPRHIINRDTTRS